jgi:predicted nucleic acid-binding protein
MAVSVIDASALSALAFNEPDASSIADLLEGQTLVAPALVVYEVGNACWKKCRREPASAANLRQAFADILHLEIELFEIEPVQVLVMAENCGITFYDASYLWLADRLKARLVTLDQRLEQMMKAFSAR